jgi:hypothetical protein
MFFDAVFGDSRKFLEDRARELEAELTPPRSPSVLPDVIEGELLDDEPPPPKGAITRRRG